MKSVLFFIECLDMGGAETILCNLISRLDKNKYNITVVSERDNEYHTEIVKKNCNYRSFIKTNKKSKLGKLLNILIIKFSLWASENSVRKALIRGEYDIEVAFCEGYATKIIGNSKSKCKKIAWVHTDMINYPWSEKIYDGNEKQCYNNYDKIVCVSGTIKESFEKKYGYADKTTVLYNAIDYESVINKSKENVELFNNKGLRIIVIGSFKKIKGHDRLIDVCTELKKQGYEFNLQLIGSGPEFEPAKEKVKRNMLEDRIQVMEYNTNPYKYLSQSDVLVCSSYAEGYSTTVTESIALGVPVITTDVSGMREIFGDKECGIICENSTEGLYKALKYVLDNPEVLKEYSKNASERAKDFDINKRVAEVEKLLDSI